MRKLSILDVVLLGYFLFLSYPLLLEPLALGWDESVYLAEGRYFFSGGEVGLIETLRPPVLPIFFGALAPFGMIESSRLLMMLFTLLGLLLVKKLGSQVSDSRAGTIALIASFTPLLLIYSVHRLTEIVAAMFILFALTAVYEKRYNFAGVLSALAFFSKYPAGVLFVTIPIVLYWNQEKHWKENILAYIKGILIVSVLLLLVLGAFGINLVSGFSLAAEHIQNPAFGEHDVFYYVSVLIQNNYLLLLGLVGIVYGLFEKRLRFIALPLLLLFMFFSNIVNKQERFALLFLPLLAVLSGVVCFELRKRFGVASYLVVGLLFIPTLQGVQEITHPDLYPEAHGPLFDKLEEVSGVVLTSVPYPAAVNDALFIPIYEDPAQGLETYYDWNESFDYILYTPDAYLCAPADGCIYQLGLLETELFKHKMVWNSTIGIYHYYLFEKTLLK